MKTSAFISKLRDPELSKMMSVAKSPQEAFEIAKAAGVTDSFEEFITEMQKLQAVLGELSEDDLVSVAGGGFSVTVAVISGATTISSSIDVTAASLDTVSIINVISSVVATAV